MAAADTIMTSRLPYPASSGGGSGHAKMPATLKFLVSSESGEEEGGLKDTGNFRRVQELFSVSMSVCSDGEGYDVVSLTGSDADRIERARCYVMAMSCPQVFSDVQCSQNVADLLLGPLRAGIERDHLIYLRDMTSRSSADSYFSEGHSHPSIKSTIRVQGMDENVSSAVSKIQTIMEMVEQGQPSLYVARTVSSNVEPGSSPYPKPVHLDYLSLKRTDPRFDVTGEGRYGNVSSTGIESSKGGKFPSLLSRDGLDPNMEKRIEYFVNLDFPRERVQSVLESLGPQASENEVMDRLMKVAPGGQLVNKSMPYRHRASPPGGDSSGSGQVDEHEQQQQQQNQQMQPIQRKIPMDPSRLRPIVIDGSNVAMRHGNGQVFSCRGIQIAVDFFKERGHEKITVFVPEWRKESSRPETPITDQYLLEKLEKEKHLVYTPSRKLNNGRRIVCYDDRYIVQLAHREGGVIVSNDQFRDLMQENPEWKKVIEQRLLQFAFVSDYFMPPDDPLGKSGPTLDQFLCKDQRELVPGLKKGSPSDRVPGSPSKPVCPHLGNCTFGKKCRYYHPDREPQQQQQQQSLPVQKQELPLTVNNSSGHRTPNTPSRSATPSPGPEGWVHGGRSSYSTIKSDRRSHGSSHTSSHSSTDDLYHERNYSSGGSSGVGLDLTTPTSTGIDISELSEELKRTSLHGSPDRKPNYSLDHGPSSNRVVSSPVFSEGTGPASLEHARPQNHTFPLVQLPQRDTRSGPNFTGDHSYLLNHQGTVVASRSHAYLTPGAPLSTTSTVSDHLARQQYQQHAQQPSHVPLDGMQDSGRHILPRDPRPSPQFLVQTPPNPLPYPQQQLAPPPSNSTSAATPGISILPPGSHHSSSSFYGADVVKDSSGSRRSSHPYQVQPGHLSQHVANNSSVPGYGIPQDHTHPNIAPPHPYSNSRGGISVDQSTTSFPGFQRLPLAQSSQSPSQFHPAQQKFIQSTVGNVSHAAQVYPPSQGYQRAAESRGGRQELFHAAVSMLPNYEQQVRAIMDQHLELSSERDLGRLLQYVQY